MPLTEHYVRECVEKFKRGQEGEDRTEAVIKFREDDEGYQRIVYAEVLIPDVPNTAGDFHTKQMVREFAHGFMVAGFDLDVDHDNVVRQDLKVVESFIARDDDPDFIPGSWVVGVYVGDDEVWEQIRRGEINGYSWEGWVKAIQAEVEMLADVSRYGRTEADMGDGHTHEFVAIVDDDGRVVAGGTTEVNGHSHTIRSHTFTEKTDGHSHIFNIIKGEGGI